MAKLSKLTDIEQAAIDERIQLASNAMSNGATDTTAHRPKWWWWWLTWITVTVTFVGGVLVFVVALLASAGNTNSPKANVVSVNVDTHEVTGPGVSALLGAHAGETVTVSAVNDEGAAANVDIGIVAEYGQNTTSSNVTDVAVIVLQKPDNTTTVALCFTPEDCIFGPLDDFIAHAEGHIQNLPDIWETLGLDVEDVHGRRTFSWGITWGLRA